MIYMNMEVFMKHRVIGSIFIILGGLVAIGPKTIFPVCDVHMSMVMKCHWTAQAESGVGLVIAILGGLLVITRSIYIRIGLNIGIILNGLLALLIPSVLIGVCEGQHMTCHSLTLPAIVVLSSIIVIIASVYLWSLYRISRKEQVKV